MSASANVLGKLIKPRGSGSLCILSLLTVHCGCLWYGRFIGVIFPPGWVCPWIILPSCVQMWFSYNTHIFLCPYSPRLSGIFLHTTAWSRQQKENLSMNMHVIFWALDVFFEGNRAQAGFFLVVILVQFKDDSEQLYTLSFHFSDQHRPEIHRLMLKPWWHEKQHLVGASQPGQCFVPAVCYGVVGTEVA